MYMDLLEASKKLFESFKSLRAKEQAEWIARYKQELIIEPMVHFNMCMIDEFDHNFWEFLCLLKEKKNCKNFNPYDTWFLWDKENEILLSANAPYHFLSSQMNLLITIKNSLYVDLVDIRTKEGAAIQRLIDASSDEVLEQTWSAIIEDKEVW